MRGSVPSKRPAGQSEALVPEPVFEDYLETTKGAGEEITTAGLLRASASQGRGNSNLPIATASAATGP